MSDHILNNTVMVLKANSLQGPRPTKGKLNKIVITHIRYIEGKIREADSNNKTFTEYKIESDFEDIIGMTNSEVQIFIYSKIIEDLTTCGYDVYFRNVPDDYTFYIKWGSAMANLEIENRKKILQIASYKYQNKKKQIHNNKINPNDSTGGLTKLNKGYLLKLHGPDSVYKDPNGVQAVQAAQSYIGDIEDEDWSTILNSN